MATPESKFIQEDWQQYDIHRLLRRHDGSNGDQHNFGGTANWSEMGCYKTSTGLWFIRKKLEEAQIQGKLDHPPSILIITNKSGKGTFFEAIPEILPEYTFLNIETNKVTIFLNGKELKLGDLKFIPKEFEMPVVCLTHYNVFSFSNKGQLETDKDGRFIKDDNGKFILKPWRQADYILDREWDFVWTDEFHRMKDKDTRWAVVIKQLKTTIGRHGSTGTGFINRPHEIWSLLNWLQPDEYTSFWDFYEKYCLIDDYLGYQKVIGIKPENKAEFRDIVRKVGVRRTLDQTHPDIQRPIFNKVEVDLNPIQRKMYDQIRTELMTLDKNGVPLHSANVLSLLSRCRQICVGTPEIVGDYFDEKLGHRVQKIKLREPSSKLDAVMEVLEGLQWDEERKEPLVVFSCFKDPLELLKARLNKHNEAVLEMGLDPEEWGYSYIHLDVKDGDIERYRKWHEEFPKMKHRVFMSTLQLGGESINLTPAHHVVFLDRSWSPKDNQQGIGRIRRPGQTSQPVVININARNTTDQYIEKVNDMKHGWFKEIFGNENGK